MELKQQTIMQLQKGLDQDMEKLRILKEQLLVRKLHQNYFREGEEGNIFKKINKLMKSGRLDKVVKKFTINKKHGTNKSRKSKAQKSRTY